jgi:ABC-2 type transport system permease protein
MRWLAGYGVVAALSAFSTGLALIMVVVLFRTFGPKRTRAISQVVSAVIGAAFVISIQVVAILSTGNISRVSLLRSNTFVEYAPPPSSLFWWPAHAAAGDMVALVALLIVGIGVLTLVILAISGQFAAYVVMAANIEPRNGRKHRASSPFNPVSIKRALRRKEWLLICRDPWLMSQSLMQILYMVPAVVLLWKSFGNHMDALLILVPVIVMASGQLAGGLAWLAVSGEDAPDLIGSAPVPSRTIVAAKVEAVLGLVALVAAPLLVGLALAAPALALAAALGVIVSSGSATLVQMWFRGQAKRSDFRRRQTSSRLATLSEALSCILWASVALLAAAGNWIALVPAILALLTLAAAWTIRPRHDR